MKLRPANLKDDKRDCIIIGDFNFGDGEEGEDMLIRR